MPNIIGKSIEFLKREGWAKGAYQHDDDGFCILGALAASRLDEDCHREDFIEDMIFDPDDELRTALNMVIKVVGDQYGFADPGNPDSPHVVAKFNDAENTKWNDVVAVLEKAEVMMDEIV